MKATFITIDAEENIISQQVIMKTYIGWKITNLNKLTLEITDQRAGPRGSGLIKAIGLDTESEKERVKRGATLWLVNKTTKLELTNANHNGRPGWKGLPKTHKVLGDEIREETPLFFENVTDILKAAKGPQTATHL